MSNKVILSKDDFNTEVFGLNFANVNYYNKDIQLGDILDTIERSDFEVIGLKIDTKESNAIYNFQKAGFYIVDCLVTYEFDSTTTVIPHNDFDVLFSDTISENDIQRLANIAASVFKIDRFHSDPNLPKSKSDDYYRKWVINSFNGFADGCILPTIDNKIVGFTTYKINNVNDHTSTMVLSAVDSDYMGKGVYYNMIKKGTIELLKKSTKIRVGTQVDNIPVQKTWQKLGYKMISAYYILHFKK